MEKNTATKEEIRKQFLEIRAGMERTDRETAGRLIADRLMHEPFYENARRIYCYAAFRDEAQTAGILEESLKRGKMVALPRVTGRRSMEFFYIKSMADLLPGKWNIPEPGTWCERAPVPDEESLVILPGAAFGRDGSRIGYGGGFYDVYLEGNTKCVKAALAFDRQCTKELPADIFDVRVDYIITEKELITCVQDCPQTR